MSLLLDFREFLDIFEIFAEDCFLLKSVRKFLPSGFLSLSRFQDAIGVRARFRFRFQAAKVPIFGGSQLRTQLTKQPSQSSSKGQYG